MAYFPLFVDLKDKNILVIGGGKVAFRKVLKLIPFEAKIIIVSPEICIELEKLLEENQNLIYKKKKVEIDDIKKSFIVISATNNKNINNLIAATCKENNIFVNSVDDIENCSFIFPALIKKDAFTAGFTTSGKAPDVAAYLKSLTEQTIPENIEQVIENLGLLRQELKSQISEQTVRAKIIHSLLEYYETNNFKLSYNELKKEMNNLIENISIKN